MPKFTHLQVLLGIVFLLAAAAMLPPSAHASIANGEDGVLGAASGDGAQFSSPSLFQSQALQGSSNDSVSSDWSALDMGNPQIPRVVDSSYVAYYTGVPVTPVTHVGYPNPSVSGGHRCRSQEAAGECRLRERPLRRGYTNPRNAAMCICDEDWSLASTYGSDLAIHRLVQPDNSKIRVGKEVVK